MWQVWLSDHPGVVFVIVEDTGRPSRAKVWRDWELSTKKWKKEKRRELDARNKRQEKAQVQVQADADTEKVKQEAAEVEKQKVHDTTDSTAAAGDRREEPDSKPSIQADAASTAGDGMQPMDVDPVDAEKSAATVDVDPAAGAIPSSSEAPAPQQTEAVPPSNIDSSSQPDKVDQGDDEIIATAGPKPKLRLSSHTRYTVSAVTSSMSAMLTALNLPPPHGAPVGTAGPGAWVPRGAAVSIEGLILEINSQSLNALPGISPALASVSSLDGAATSLSSNGAGSAGLGGSGAVDWRVRVGSVMGGGGRSAGAIVEAEFLPVSTLLPTSKFMQDFLHSLFPPNLVPLPPPGGGAALPSANVLGGTGGPSRTTSAAGTPQTSNATLGISAAGVNGSTQAAGTARSASGFSYTIGGGAGSGSTAPNRNFNVPVISDQLWEEVVPRSGESWRTRIAKRSRRVKVASRAQRRQRKTAAASETTQSHDQSKGLSNGAGAREDQAGWYTFGSDNEAVASGSVLRNGDWHDLDEDEEEVSSSDSEAEQDIASGAGAAGSGLAGTAVTMQQVDEDDDDDDDDRPLGAPIWSNANRTASAPNAANINTPPATVPVTGAPSGPTRVKKEDTVQLIFQGLRPDETEGVPAEANGWTGIERGRRIAFQYVQMLRAEGII